jgi:hypothetical protein
VPINADKPHLWKPDIAQSVDLFNSWFMKSAPAAYRATRAATTQQVKNALEHTNDLRYLVPETIKRQPEVLPTLRMSTAPPIARDRLIGLAGVPGSLVHRLEKGKLPARMSETLLSESLARVCEVIGRLLDEDVFPWLGSGSTPSDADRTRAATIVADRLCGAVADPIIRNAQEKRQLALIEDFLERRHYHKQAHPRNEPLTAMEPGTFSFRMIVVVGTRRKVNIPIDVVIQPKVLRPNRLPVLIEAKSAGDFTNTNKRRKEEATKIHQLRQAYGPEIQLILFLCGYFDSGYLGYEAAEGLDWVWEHRIEDLREMGI